MLRLRIRFLAGRYHATAWDHHVNEGTIEWPPSPWRLLRALVAAYHRVGPAVSEETMNRLLEALAESLPAYHLPAWAEGHTRHYMPLDNKGLPGDKSAMIFNAFVAPGSGADAADGELDVIWQDVSLEEEQRTLLSTLCEHIPYLGRAESWVELSVVEDGAAEERPINCEPASVSLGSEQRSIRLMALARRAEFVAWREDYVEGLPKKKRAAVPETLLDILHQDTGDLRSEGWSSVPGTRWVSYAFTKPRAPQRRTPQRARPDPSVALYALAGPVLPPVTKSLQVGERMHAALVSWSDDGGGPHPAFATRNLGGVDHASVSPLDLDGDGKLDHVLVHMASGFDARARRALERGRRLYGVGNLSLALTLVGAWGERELEDIPQQELPPVLRSARVWRSATPFVLVRHPKRKRNGAPRLDAEGVWIDGPTEQIRLELSRRGLPTPVEVTSIDALEIGGRTLPWHRFQRERRKGGGARGGDRGYGFEIRFPEEVRGPILAGYGRFFGLGQFAPSAD